MTRMRNVDALRRQAEQAGAVIGRYAAALLDIPLPWTRMRRVYALLGLVRRYGAARVTVAGDERGKSGQLQRELIASGTNGQTEPSALVLHAEKRVPR